MGKKTTPVDAEFDLFRQAVADVTPLKASARVEVAPPRRRPPAKRGRHLQADIYTSGQEYTTDASHINAEDGGYHRKNGVQARLMQRLKRGQYPPGDQLDLHNLSLQKAQTVLFEFIQLSVNRRLRCVRIIHGKGMRAGGISPLKTMVRERLREHPCVLAFTRCKPAEGGDGATDVLLRASCSN